VLPDGHSAIGYGVHNPRPAHGARVSYCLGIGVIAQDTSQWCIQGKGIGFQTSSGNISLYTSIYFGYLQEGSQHDPGAAIVF
jgi:hypothetical protein